MCELVTSHTPHPNCHQPPEGYSHRSCRAACLPPPPRTQPGHAAQTACPPHAHTLTLVMQHRLPVPPPPRTHTHPGRAAQTACSPPPHVHNLVMQHRLPVPPTTCTHTHPGHAAQTACPPWPPPPPPRTHSPWSCSAACQTHPGGRNGGGPMRRWSQMLMITMKCDDTTSSRAARQGHTRFRMLMITTLKCDYTTSSQAAR